MSENVLYVLFSHNSKTLVTFEALFNLFVAGLHSNILTNLYKPTL